MAAGTPGQRTSVNRTRAYRRALVDVAKELTKEDVKKLAWECSFIDRSEQCSIQNGIHLLDAMEECEYISEINVKNLVGLLTQRGFKKAASILETYIGR